MVKDVINKNNFLQNSFLPKGIYVYVVLILIM